jgi:hypothetical protein
MLVAVTSFNGSADTVVDAAPPVTLEPTAVVASVTPSAQTAWVSMDRIRFEGDSGPHLASWLVKDDDHDGTVRLVYPGGLPQEGTWLGADLKNSTFIAARRFYGIAGVYGVQENAFPPKVFIRDAAGAYSHLAVAVARGGCGEVMLARPALGAWFMLACDGSRADRDEMVHGRASFDMVDFEAIGSSPSRRLPLNRATCSPYSICTTPPVGGATASIRTWPKATGPEALPCRASTS